KVWALVAAAVLGAVACFGYWAMQPDQTPATPLTLPSPPSGGEGAKEKPSPPPAGEGAKGKPSPPEGGEGRVRGAADAAAPLPTRAAVRPGTPRTRHGTVIVNLTVSADGKLAVTSSGNSPYNPALAGRFSPARVFDLTDGRCLYSLPNEHGAYSEYPEAV